MTNNINFRTLSNLFKVTHRVCGRPQISVQVSLYTKVLYFAFFSNIDITIACVHCCTRLGDIQKHILFIDLFLLLKTFTVFLIIYILNILKKIN